MHDTLITIGKGCLLAIIFILAPIIVRLWMESKKIPVEKKLEWSLHRGARALRRLSQARRNAMLAPKIAARVAAKACRELRTVQRIVTGDGCPVAILRRLEEARNAPLVSATLPIGDSAVLQHEASHELNAAASAVREWKAELSAADEKLAREADPTIYRSGGTLRNPFKQHSLDETGQSESIINVRRSQEDMARVEAALAKTAEAVSFPSDNLLREAIMALDSALADADMPLPPKLATGESPHDYSNPPPPPGALQRLHATLSALHNLQSPTDLP
jgi:hypothetical protein